MAFADRLPPFARLEFLGKYQAEGRLVAAGFLAGFLLFLAWWAFQPRLGARPGVGATAAADAAAQPAIGDRNGVLDGITGAPAPGRGDAGDVAMGGDALADADAEAGQDMLAPDEAAAQELQDGQLATEEGGDGDAIAPPAPGEEAGAIPMPVSPETATLQRFYLEVERGPGVNEIIRIDATSPEQALAILRDYRGDPPVVRGPSLQPLD
jgi:hypothetical protein